MGGMTIFPRKRMLLIGALVALNAALFAVSPALMSGPAGSADSKEISPEVYAAAITGPDADFRSLSRALGDAAQEYGAAFGFDVLRIAELPDNVDVHLLAHTVGDILYQQEGVAGIEICTHEFRNACSHSVVIGSLLESGTGALPEISDACHRAPGGKGAYTMCFHGFGHGALAYTGYDMEAMVDLCREVGTAAYGNREYIECIGGAVMEMMSGVHDREVWEQQSARYLPEDDPFAPCSMDFMPQEAKAICYTYLTPRLFEIGGSGIANPTTEDFESAMALCATMPDAEKEWQEVCYGSFGKEFVVLAQGRDVRNIDGMDAEQLRFVYDSCMLAPSSQGREACLMHAQNSLYWGGENDPKVSATFCSVMTDAAHETMCWERLASIATYFAPDTAALDRVCNLFPEHRQEACKEGGAI